ncbi:MAG: DUF3791 domain-containing protein [Elusimicrobiota bacterium]|jgi:hypothetical protein|nr:DUF3791 domain-containing protein [Elusimicrobiota bacterium]
MTQKKRDQNLMIVYAVEGYSQKYNMRESDVLTLFMKNGITDLIRKHYNALHTQGFDEGFYFADDVLKRKMKENTFIS